MNKIKAIVDIIGDYYEIAKTNINYDDTIDNFSKLIPKLITLINKIVDKKIEFSVDEMEEIKEKCIIKYNIK